MLRNCGADYYVMNKSRMVRIAEYSRDCMKALRAETGIQYEGRQGGTLQLFRTQKQLDNAANDIAVLKQEGVAYRLLSAGELHEAEPALAHAEHKLAGGLQLPNDETGDCNLFTKRLAEMAEQAGVKFRFGVNIHRLQFSGDRVSGVICDEEVITGDQYVVALGSYSTKLLHGHIAILVYPLKGYSLTMPIIDESRAPASTVLDETYKIAVTRFDQRIRVGGMAEVVGFNLDIVRRRCETLKMVVQDLYGGGGDISKATFWTGLRPMTPDGTPIVGPTAYSNLFLNTGHGTLGWTMACGSGQLLADIMSGDKPAIRADDLAVSRYLNGFRTRLVIPQQLHTA